jgi:hypothetical protein
MAIKLLLHHSSRKHTRCIQLITDAAWFAVEYFELDQHNWRVEIEIVDRIQDSNRGTTVGLCYYYGRDARRSAIVVAARWRSVAGILSTLFHEFAHVKQLLKGEIYYGPNGSDLWKSQQILRKATTFEDYLNRPDEVDARYHAKIMLRKYSMKRMKQMFSNLAARFTKTVTEEQLDWHYNDRKSSNAEMQGRQANIGNPKEKDYNV